MDGEAHSPMLCKHPTCIRVDPALYRTHEPRHGGNLFVHRDVCGQLGRAVHAATIAQGRDRPHIDTTLKVVAVAIHIIPPQSRG